jgi:acetyl esterase/lipase
LKSDSDSETLEVKMINESNEEGRYDFIVVGAGAAGAVLAAEIALTGDSGRGNLALVLLSIASATVSKGGIAPVGAVAFSPVTDLALTGESYDTRAEADPFFTRSQVAGLVRAYLGEAEPKNPQASRRGEERWRLPGGMAQGNGKLRVKCAP